MKNILTAIIVDDEEHCRFSLQKQLEWTCPDVEVIALASSANEAREILKNNSVDIVFLDIEMPGGNGFDLIRSLRDIDFSVIFTTAYDEFALEAFKIDAIDYLLKPIDGNELVKAVKKVNHQNDSQVSENLQDVRSFMDRSFMKTRKVGLPVSDGIELVSLDLIIRCESAGSYCHVFFKDKTSLFLSKTLKQVTEMLDDRRFVRVHHSHLVNMDYVKRYIRGKGGQVLMEDMMVLPVSRSRKDDLLDMF